MRIKNFFKNKLIANFPKRLIFIGIISLLTINFFILPSFIQNLGINEFINMPQNNGAVDLEIKSVQYYSEEWNASWGGSISEVCHAVAVNKNNNSIYFTGTTQSYGGVYGYIAEYNSSGNKLWNITWSTGGAVWSRDIAVDNEGYIYICGDESNNMFLVKFNATGTLIWNISWGGGSSDVARAMAIDADNNIYVTGYTYSWGNGTADLFIAKFNSTGHYKWNSSWGSVNSDDGYGIALDDSNNIYVGGYTQYYGNYDMLVVKFNSSGGFEWFKTWGITGVEERGWDLTLDGSNNVYLTGYNHTFAPNEYDLILIKYDANGTQIWEQIWKSMAWEEGWGLDIDGNNNIFITGKTGQNILTIEYNSTGYLLWNKTWNDQIDMGYDIALDKYNNIIIGGITQPVMGISDNATYIKYALDTDNDGISDEHEIVIHNTNYTNPDTDGDGLSDGVEVNDYGTNPNDSDSDDDDLSDAEELIENTDPLNNDTDNDFMPDGWELHNSLNPLVADWYLDLDNDGLFNLMEFLYNTNPICEDTDGDGYLDGEEIYSGTDPTQSNSFPFPFQWLYLILALIPTVILIIFLILRRPSIDSEKVPKSKK